PEAGPSRPAVSPSEDGRSAVSRTSLTAPRRATATAGSPVARRSDTEIRGGSAKGKGKAKARATVEDLDDHGDGERSAGKKRARQDSGSQVAGPTRPAKRSKI